MMFGTVDLISGVCQSCHNWSNSHLKNPSVNSNFSIEIADLKSSEGQHYLKA